MQVFVGCDSGNVVPHVYYQACQVTSKTVDDIKEEKINGTSVIEVPVTPLMDMRLRYMLFYLVCRSFISYA